jgi:hypothetical protein
MRRGICNSYIHTYTHTYIHTYTHLCVHTHTYKRLCVHSYIHKWFSVELCMHAPSTYQCISALNSPEHESHATHNSPANNIPTTKDWFLRLARWLHILTVWLTILTCIRCIMLLVCTYVSAWHHLTLNISAEKESTARTACTKKPKDPKKAHMLWHPALLLALPLAKRSWMPWARVRYQTSTHICRVFFMQEFGAQT